MSSALKHLEDMGYETFDNTPLDQIEDIISDTDMFHNYLAFSVTVRTRGFSASNLLQLKSRLEKNPRYKIKVFYITCDEEILERRYSETRRRHPLAGEKGYAEGIEKEKKLLEDVPHFAEEIIDTSETTVAELKELLKQKLGGDTDDQMSIKIMSFGFKNGVPRDADIVHDVRFLRNPHYDTSLKPKTGKHKDVQDYILEDKNFEEYFEKLKSMTDFLIPRFRKEGKSHLTIAIGCTGGKHRSVFIAERLRDSLTSLDGAVSVQHRDLGLE